MSSFVRLRRFVVIPLQRNPPQSTSPSHKTAASAASAALSDKTADFGRAGKTPGMHSAFLDMSGEFKGMSGALDLMSGALESMSGMSQGLSGESCGLSGGLQGMSGKFAGMPGAFQGKPGAMRGMSGRLTAGTTCVREEGGSPIADLIAAAERAYAIKTRSSSKPDEGIAFSPAGPVS